MQLATCGLAQVLKNAGFHPCLAWLRKRRLRVLSTFGAGSLVVDKANMWKAHSAMQQLQGNDESGDGAGSRIHE